MSDVTTVPLVLATRNVHKVGELQVILTDAGVDVSLVGMDAFPDVPDVVEDGRRLLVSLLAEYAGGANITRHWLEQIVRPVF